MNGAIEDISSRTVLRCKIANTNCFTVLSLITYVNTKCRTRHCDIHIGSFLCLASHQKQTSQSLVTNSFKAKKEINQAIPDPWLQNSSQWPYKPMVRVLHTDRYVEYTYVVLIRLLFTWYISNLSTTSRKSSLWHPSTCKNYVSTALVFVVLMQLRCAGNRWNSNNRNCCHH